MSRSREEAKEERRRRGRVMERRMIRRRWVILKEETGRLGKNKEA